MTLIDLKALRNKAVRRNEDGKFKPWSRSDLATAISHSLGRPIHETQIVRYEEDSQKIPFDLLECWLICLGTSLLEQLQQPTLSRAHPGIDAGTPYITHQSRIALIQEYVAADTHGYLAALPGLPSALQDLLAKLAAKPNIVIVGAVGAGKTTLANWIVGFGNLPTSIASNTMATTFIRHQQDKPAGIFEDVVLLDDGFDSAQWNDTQHIAAHRIMAGGTGTYRRYDQRESDISGIPPAPSYAMVFTDNPILLACNVTDTVGLDGDEQNYGKVFSMVEQADALIYASPASGYMTGNDVAILKECLKRLPVIAIQDENTTPYDNVFIVATHATPDLDIDDRIEHICRQGIRRLLHEMDTPVPDGIPGDVHSAPDEIALLKRVFPYWPGSSHYSKPLEKDLHHLLANQLPQALRERARRSLETFKDYVVKRIGAEILALHAIADDPGTSDATSTLPQDLTQEIAQLRDLQHQLQTTIQQCHQDNLRDLRLAHFDLINPDVIANIIKSRYPGNARETKRQAQQNAGSHILDLLKIAVIQSRNDKLRRLEPLLIELSCMSKLFPIDFLPARKFHDAARAGSEALREVTPGGLEGLETVLVSLSANLAASFFGKSFFGEEWQLQLAKQIVKRLRDMGSEKKLVETVDTFWEQIATTVNTHFENKHREIQGLAYWPPENIAMAREDAIHRSNVLKNTAIFIQNIPWF